MVRKLNSELEVKTDEAPAWTGRQKLTTLVTELQRQLDARRDLVINGRHIDVRVDDGKPWLMLANCERLRVNDEAFSQFCNRLTPKVPVEFMRKLMVEHPHRAETMLEGVLQDDGRPHLVRVLDNRVRAVVSDAYKCLDNYDVADAALRAVREHDGVMIQASLSENHMRLKFTTPHTVGRIEDEAIQRGRTDGFVRIGDGGGNQSLQSVRDLPPEMYLPYGPHSLFPTVTISNSETGRGMFVVQIGILLAFCTNGCVTDKIAESVHLGSRVPEGVLRRETIEVRSRATLMESVDAIGAAFDKGRFDLTVRAVNSSFAETIDDAPKAVDATMKMLGATVRQDERDALLAYFTRDYSQSRGGLAQAVSRLAQDVEDPDREHALEEAAGRLLVAMR